MGMGSESRRWFRRAAGPAALAAVCAALLSPASASAEAPGFLYEFGDTGNGPGQFSFPDSLSPFGGGATVDIFVADAENNRIQVLRQENGQSSQFLTQFGALGSGPGQLSTPSGVVKGGLGT